MLLLKQLAESEQQGRLRRPDQPKRLSFGLSEQEIAVGPGAYETQHEMRVDARIRYWVKGAHAAHRYARDNAIKQMATFLYGDLLRPLDRAIGAVEDRDWDAALEQLLAMRAEIVQ